MAGDNRDHFFIICSRVVKRQQLNSLSKHSNNVAEHIDLD